MSSNITVTIPIKEWEEMQKRYKGIKRDGFYCVRKYSYMNFSIWEEATIEFTNERLAALADKLEEAAKAKINTERKLNRIPSFIRKIFGA